LNELGLCAVNCRGIDEGTPGEMFSFFKKKSPLYPHESKWSAIQGSHGGKPMFLRRNDSAAQLAGHPDYKHRVGVAVPLRAPNEHGLPSNDEMNTLGVFEDLLASRLEAGEESIQVLVITTDGMREYIFYTRDPAGANAILESLRAETSSHEVQSYIAEDPKWQIYKQFN
jgi:hypothetical protein